MNALDHTVTKIITPAYEKYFRGYVFWEVIVEYDCYGDKGITTLRFDTEEEAKQVKVGYVFQA